MNDYGDDSPPTEEVASAEQMTDPLQAAESDDAEAADSSVALKCCSKVRI